MLIGLIGQETALLARAAADVKPIAADDLDFWEGRLEQGVSAVSMVGYPSFAWYGFTVFSAALWVALKRDWKKLRRKKD